MWLINVIMGPVLLENESTLRESQETADNARHYKCTDAEDRFDISKNSWGTVVRRASRSTASWGRRRNSTRKRGYEGASSRRQARGRD